MRGSKHSSQGGLRHWALLPGTQVSPSSCPSASFLVEPWTGSSWCQGGCYSSSCLLQVALCIGRNEALECPHTPVLCRAGKPSHLISLARKCEPHYVSPYSKGCSRSVLAETEDRLPQLFPPATPHGALPACPCRPSRCITFSVLVAPPAHAPLPHRSVLACAVPSPKDRIPCCPPGRYVLTLRVFAITFSGVLLLLRRGLPHLEPSTQPA